MERKHVRNTLKKILEDETDTSIQDLPDETIVTEVFGLDSVDRVSLMMRVEDSFRIRLTNEELTRIDTVGSLIDIVQAKVAAPSGTQTMRRAA